MSFPKDVASTALDLQPALRQMHQWGLADGDLGYAYWHDIAKLLVSAQALGLARPCPAQHGAFREPRADACGKLEKELAFAQLTLPRSENREQNMDDKKDYKATLKALDATISVAAVLNKLGEIAVDTEDAKLKHALTAVSTRLRAIHSKPTAKVRLLSLPAEPMFVNLTAAVAQTATYCNACKDSAHPQWEILARQAGWTPPAARDKTP